jgi:phosphate transport system substrate-binding protein
VLLLTGGCNSKSKDGRTDSFYNGSIQVAVDESFLPILQEETAVYEGLYPDTKLTPLAVTQPEAIRLLLTDSVRLAVAGRRLTKQETAVLESRKFFPREIKLATDGLALIVHPQNPDTLISVEQLRQLLTGKATTWQAINPKSRLGTVIPVFDNPNSSGVHYLTDSICRGEALGKNVKALHTNREVIDYVKRTPQAIGIIGVNWLSDRNDSTGLTFYREVGVMSVSAAPVPTPQNSFKPYQAYLYTGQYPLARSLYVLLTDPREGLATGFGNFLTTDRGQRIILKSGLVPATQPVRIVQVND